jgi:membrane peptidoglycan carboxypeptidase
MGYDDNTPLTGVTGGGLPAEIWQEAMARIHEGRPMTPLPMIRPDREARPAPQIAREPVPDAPSPQAPLPDLAERILMDVLGGIFRRN